MNVIDLRCLPVKQILRLVKDQVIVQPVSRRMFVLEMATKCGKMVVLLVSEVDIELTDHLVNVKLQPYHQDLHGEADTVVHQVMGARIQEMEEMACSPELSWIMLHFVVGARIHEVEEMVCLPELDHASVCKRVCKNMRV